MNERALKELLPSWSNPCNWSKNHIPTETENVHISASAPHQPSVDMDGKAKSVNLSLGAILRILSGWDLEVD